jgi:hypothetical protein
MTTIKGANITLNCGHVLKDAYCWQTQDPESVQCKVSVERTVAKCGHTVSVECFRDINKEDFRCHASCGAPLPCGHDCKWTTDVQEAKLNSSRRKRMFPLQKHVQWHPR